MPRKRSEELQRVNLMLEKSLVERIEKHQDRIAKSTGIKPNRTDAVRALLSSALAHHEA
jgi:hypothetical protein